MRLVGATMLVAAGLLLAGCAGKTPQFVPVSGVVKFNGKPYTKGVVSFQPVGTEGNPNPGRGSAGYTDENGRFTLKTDDGQEGAVVGKHRVRIMTRLDSFGFDPELGTPDGDPKKPAKAYIDPIPPEWFATGVKEFDVPPGGTDQANFDIFTKNK